MPATLSKRDSNIDVTEMLLYYRDNFQPLWHVRKFKLCDLFLNQTANSNLSPICYLKTICINKSVPRKPTMRSMEFPKPRTNFLPTVVTIFFISNNTRIHAFFCKQRFFQYDLTFSWIELQILLRCCLLHISIIILRHFLYYLPDLCPCIDLGLFMSYLFPFFRFHLHFDYD